VPSPKVFQEGIDTESRGFREATYLLGLAPHRLYGDDTRTLRAVRPVSFEPRHGLLLHEPDVYPSRARFATHDHTPGPNPSRRHPESKCHLFTGTFQMESGQVYQVYTEGSRGGPKWKSRRIPPSRFVKVWLVGRNA